MKTKIIVADDSEEMRKKLKERLEQEGFEVIEAENGDISLDYALEFTPSLIIAEVDMPIMDGWSLCTNIYSYEETRDIPVILIGSFNKVTDRVKAISVGAIDYISKPFQIEDLIARVYLALEKRKEKKEKRKRQELEEISLAGDIKTMSLSDIIQNLLNTQKSGVLEIFKEKGEEGYIYFNKGNIINAKLNKLKGKKALVRILSWKEGKFKFLEKEPTCIQNIYGNTISILLDTMRMIDELDREKSNLPNFNKMLVINFSKEFFKWGLVNAHPTQIRLLSLIHIHHTIQKIMDHTDIDDLTIAKEISFLLQKGIISVR